MKKILSQEKAMLLIGISIIALLLVYDLFWFSPWINSSRLKHKEENAIKLFALENQALSLEKKPILIRNKDLQKFIHFFQEKIKQSSFQKQLKKISVVYPNKVYCRFENSYFDDLINWLIHFLQQEHCTVQEASVRRTNNDGLVKAEFIIQLD